MPLRFAPATAAIWISNTPAISQDFAVPAKLQSGY
jgi:hypothetical protein